jgi:hypothetical protein
MTFRLHLLSCAGCHSLINGQVLRVWLRLDNLARSDAQLWPNTCRVFVRLPHLG